MLSSSRVARRSCSLLWLSLLLGFGCSSAELAQMSAEPTACAAEQLEISDSHQPMEGPSSWTATCTTAEGSSQKWFCSKAHERVICTEDPT